MKKDYKKAIAQARRGDQDAFTRLYEWSSRRVYYTSRELLGNDADAEDVTQETYLAAFSRLDELKKPAQFEAWVSRIAVHKSINLLKKNGRLVPLPDEGSTEELPDRGDACIPGEILQKNELAEQLLRLLKASLTEAQYRCVILYYYEEMSISEIARLLDCPEGTVGWRLSTAREKLKEAVRESEKKGGYSFQAGAFLPLALLLCKSEANAAPPMMASAPPSPLAGAGKLSGSAAKALRSVLHGRMALAGAVLAVGIAAAASVTAAIRQQHTAAAPESAEAASAESSGSAAPEVGFPIYQFGNYHDATNWYVLAQDERGLLLLAENVVDVLPFDDDYATEEWAECSLREWLNTDFCEVAFRPDEMARILNIEGDKVFLLDYDEAYEYFAEAQQRLAYPSKYALQRAAEMNLKGDGIVGEAGTACWYLRSVGNTGEDGLYVVEVNRNGYVIGIGTRVDERGRGYEKGVRPAIWITAE